MDYPITNDDAAFLIDVASGCAEPFGHREHLRLAFLDARAGSTVDDVIESCHPELLATSYLERFYTPERLAGDAARCGRVAPDRAPLP